MILFSDVHLDEDSKDVVLNDVLPGVFRAAQDRGDRHIGMLGDFWHIRYKVSVKLQNAVRDEIRRWVSHGLKVYILPGNHDQIDIHGRHAMEVFEDIPNVQVFTQPGWNEWGLWVPYRKRPEEIVRAMQLTSPWKKGRPPSVLFLHQGILNSWMNDHIQDVEGLPLEMFSGWQRVLMGHYHLRQTIGHASYIGSPWQVTAHEAGQDKGYAVWDGKNLEYVTTRWGPRFHKIRVEAGQEVIDTSDIAPGDDVRIDASVGVNLDKLHKVLESTGAAHTVTPEINVNEARLEVKPGSGLREYAMAYVEAMDSDLDPNRLMKIYEGVVRE